MYLILVSSMYYEVVSLIFLVMDFLDIGEGFHINLYMCSFIMIKIRELGSTSSIRVVVREVDHGRARFI